MPPDWTRVTVAHVRQACKLYDSGEAIPPRPAKNTFLLLDGNSYPAKFIRGLAYRLATGIQVDPSVDYAGGLETVRFFDHLGLRTQYDPHTGRTEPLKPAITRPAIHERPITRSEIAEPQKRALAALLCRRYGHIETEVRFPWLVVPRPDKMDEPVSSIFSALKATGRPPRDLRGDEYRVAKPSLE